MSLVHTWFVPLERQAFTQIRVNRRPACRNVYSGALTPLRLGFERSEAPGGAPRYAMRVIPRRYISAAGVVLCGREVCNHTEGSRAIRRAESCRTVGRVVAHRVAGGVACGR